jgi:alkylhydroperoxidase/carboxymuconolactone decarboxylase family protein YurZ
MPDLRSVLTDSRLERLRAAYDPQVMRAAMLHAIVEGFPPLDAWNRAIAGTFYDDPNPLTPRDRERCLIAVLTNTGPQLSLAIHVYWGLMVGLSVEEVCHTAGLAASYAGVPRLAVALPAIQRVLELLDQLDGDMGSQHVLQVILGSFARSI